jgi:prephenate dehydrogenase
VVAVPPGRTARALIRLQELQVAATYTHVASVQAHVQAEVESLSPDASRVVGGHPLAGRELSGPYAAVADLFIGRPWAVCAGPRSAPDAVEAVVQLARECGASPLLLPASDHDRAVAVSSHLPQVASSVLAGVLLEGPADLRLAGPGLADTTRLAAGDAGLWTDILAANAAEVAVPVRVMAGRLSQVADALEALADSGADSTGASAVLRDALERGNRGRARVPLKRGEVSGAFKGLRVVVEDAPGRLAALLAAAGEAEVNVEDVRVEHVPGRPTGVIELLVSPTAIEQLRAALLAAGWRVV